MRYKYDIDSFRHAQHDIHASIGRLTFSLYIGPESNEEGVEYRLVVTLVIVVERIRIASKEQAERLQERLYAAGTAKLDVGLPQLIAPRGIVARHIFIKGAGKPRAHLSVREAERIGLRLRIIFLDAQVATLEQQRHHVGDVLADRRVEAVGTGIHPFQLVHLYLLLQHQLNHHRGRG